MQYKQNIDLRCFIPISYKKYCNDNGKKILLCHDMRGNYLSDKHNFGSEYKNAYQVLQWDVIDIFCYFSHNLITIPPISWIYTAKQHGTQVIGTFITEWDQG
jgi:mannosyl-glycoprotein endo-beta-N-acetylglucosaminidase